MDENLDANELTEEELAEVTGGTWKKGALYKLTCKGVEHFFRSKKAADLALEEFTKQGKVCHLYFKP